MNAATTFPQKRGPKPSSYASAPEIKKLIKAAKDAGLDVGGFRALPDRTVEIFTAATQAKPGLFDQLEQAGKL